MDDKSPLHECVIWHRASRHAAARLASPLVIAEEERLSADHRAAHHDAEFVAVERRRFESPSAVDEVRIAVEEVPRLKPVVAVELVEGSMQVIRARLGHHADLTACAAAELGGVAVHLDPEFLDRVHRRPERDARVPLVGVGDAVELKRVLFRARAVDADTAARSAPGCPVFTPGTSSASCTKLRPFSGSSESSGCR